MTMTSPDIESAPSKQHRIFHLAAECRSAFEDASLILPERLRALHSRFTESDLEDEFEQFRVWARNIDAFASDEASLDYRLREAPLVVQTIVSLLGNIRTKLSECK